MVLTVDIDSDGMQSSAEHFSPDPSKNSPTKKSPPVLAAKSPLLARLSASVRSLPTLTSLPVGGAGDCGYAVQACASTGDVFLMPRAEEVGDGQRTAPLLTASCDRISSIPSRKASETPQENLKTPESKPAAAQPLLKVSEVKSDCESGDAGQTNSADSSWRESVKQSKIWQVLKNPEARMTVAIYSLSSFSVIGYDEVFTVFASTDRSLSKSSSSISRTQLLDCTFTCKLYMYM